MAQGSFFDNVGKRQLIVSDFIPKLRQHITEQIVYYDEGYFAFGVRLTGFNFEGVDEKNLYAKYKIFNHALTSFGKQFGKSGAITSIVQRKKYHFSADYIFGNPFIIQFAEKYIRNLNQQDCFKNEFNLIFLIKEQDFKLGLKKAEEQIQVIINMLADFEPKLLSTYENRYGVMFSELYDLFSSLINAHQDPCPLSTEDAYQVLPSASIHFGNNLLEIRNNNQKKWAQIYDLRDFGLSNLKVLAPILSLPAEFNLVHDFAFLDNSKILSKVRKQLNEFLSVQDKAFYQQEELIELEGQVTSGNLNFGTLRSSLMVLGSSPEDAIDKGSRAYSLLLNSGGFRYQKSGWSAPATYFSQIPGSKAKPRPLTKAITNFSHIAYPYDYATGKEWHNPLGDGSAVMPLLTDSKTLYFFNFHYTNLHEQTQDKPVVGHTLILGKSETGKTTLNNALLSFLMRFTPYMFVLDLDQGMEIFLRVIGGQYFQLKIGHSTGMNPFKLPANDKNIDFLTSLVEMCAGEDLTPEEELAIKEAVETVLHLEEGNRDFSHLLQNIHLAKLRMRLQKWTREGRFGWVFDNPDNIFKPEEFRMVGFDLTEILRSEEETYPPTQPILAYMLHLREMMMQNVAKEDNQSYMATVIEEFWFATKYPRVAEEIKKILKSERKRHNFAILVSQSPADAIKSPIFEAIVEQTATKIFLPNPSAEYKDSYERCGITQTEFDRITNLPEKSRQFLIKQGHQSAIARLNLHGFDEELAVLSGTSANVALMHQMMEEYGHDNWYQPWIETILQRRGKNEIT
ncbi:MAG: conjugal transfer protein [Neisseriaceae bacterium]|nr:conjugal transfer protein [Neisseriaceae bacterium]